MGKDPKNDLFHSSTGIGFNLLFCYVLKRMTFLLVFSVPFKRLPVGLTRRIFITPSWSMCAWYLWYGIGRAGSKASIAIPHSFIIGSGSPKHS